MTKPIALIVDDEPDIRELLQMTLARMQIQTVDAKNLSEAKKHLGQHSFALCLTDMRLPDGDGIELVQYIQDVYPQIPVAVITAYGNVEGAVNTLKAGAFDYVSKPINLAMLRNLVDTALKLSDKTEDNEEKSQSKLLGKSKVIKDLIQTIKKLARSQAPVFISGESGTGKELVARLIHEKGPRENQPFVPVNCGAIPSELMESEFFGHKKGSFTGAVSDKEGLFQAAHGGTLFLDEIADLPLSMQVKLLRAIQEKAIRPVGSQKEISVDVRILSATHKDLSQLVKDGSFRQDLFYRINVIKLELPSLREHIEDLSILADHILNKLTAEHETEKPEITPESLSALKRFSFPGNIRELENILERAITLCENNIITPKDLQLSEESCLPNDSDNDNEEYDSLDTYLDQKERAFGRDRRYPITSAYGKENS